MLDVLRGLSNANPAVVGGLRGILEAMAIAGLGAAVVLLESVSWGDYALYAPAVFAGLRLLEGVLDGIDPAKKRAA